MRLSGRRGLIGRRHRRSRGRDPGVPDRALSARGTGEARIHTDIASGIPGAGRPAERTLSVEQPLRFGEGRRRYVSEHGVALELDETQGLAQARDHERARVAVTALREPQDALLPCTTTRAPISASISASA